MVRTHPQASGDFISRELSKLAARRIRERPEIVSAGLERLTKWMERPGYDPGRAMALNEWKTIILTRAPEEVAEILEMESQEGQRLRSSMPFIRPPFFTEEERREVIERAFS